MPRKPPPAGWFEKARKEADKIERDTGVKIDFIQGGWLEPEPKPGERWLTLDDAHVWPQQGDPDA